MWKGVVELQFEVVFRNFPGSTE